jgi:hypothetical protein
LPNSLRLIRGDQSQTQGKIRIFVKKVMTI